MRFVQSVHYTYNNLKHYTLKFKYSNELLRFAIRRRRNFIRSFGRQREAKGQVVQIERRNYTDSDFGSLFNIYFNVRPQKAKRMFQLAI